MSSATFPTSPPQSNATTQSANCLSLVATTAVASGFSGFVAWSFSIVSLPTALAFGATESLVRQGIYSAFDDKKQVTLESFFSSLIKSAAIFAASNVAAFAITQALGFPITFSAAVSLSVAMYVTSCVITALALGCLCCTCVALLLGAAVSDANQAGTS